MAETRKHARAPTGGERRERILKAARQVFAEEGLEGASLRAIALRAGYTPAALYFYFESKEDMYAEVLRGSLRALGEAVAQAVSRSEDARDRLRAAAMAFFRFYAERPRDLDLGFYLFRGGMKPSGLGRDRDIGLNAALEAALRPIAEAAVALGAPPERANLLMVDCFAHAAGLLLLLHTGRIRMFGASAAELMVAHVDDRIRQLEEAPAMPTIDPARSLLLLIDFQQRLMPVIHEADQAIRNAGRLIEAARLLDIPRLFTEQNARGLGPTVAEIAVEADRLVHKQSFDSCREPGFLDWIPKDAQVVVAGCEAHVCVQQTVLGLLDARRQTYVVRDAIGARRPENREASLRRMERHGAEVVTTEMVVFEWMQTAEHPRFRDLVALIK